MSALQDELETKIGEKRQGLDRARARKLHALRKANAAHTAAEQAFSTEHSRISTGLQALQARYEGGEQDYDSGITELERFREAHLAAQLDALDKAFAAQRAARELEEMCNPSRYNQVVQALPAEFNHDYLGRRAHVEERYDQLNSLMLALLEALQ